MGGASFDPGEYKKPVEKEEAVVSPGEVVVSISEVPVQAGEE